MKRRTVVILGASGVVAAATGTALVLLNWRRPDLTGLSEAAQRLGFSIHARLPPLEVEDAAYVSFLEDLETHQGAIKEGREATSKLVQRFLMSTDFFLHGADESRRISYARYYDPYVSPCYDPLNQPEADD